MKSRNYNGRNLAERDRNFSEELDYQLFRLFLKLFQFFFRIAPLMLRYRDPMQFNFFRNNNVPRITMPISIDKIMQKRDLQKRTLTVYSIGQL